MTRAQVQQQLTTSKAELGSRFPGITLPPAKG